MADFKIEENVTFTESYISLARHPNERLLTKHELRTKGILLSLHYVLYSILYAVRY